jgi:hypothetical protein
MFTYSSASIELSSCHVEYDKTNPVILIVCTGGSGQFLMRGGYILCSRGGTTPIASYIVDTGTGVNTMIFDNVLMNNLQTTTNFFATGSGRCIVNSRSYNLGNNPRLVSINENKLKDGLFQGTTIEDTIFINKDTASITNALTGTAIQISLDNTTFYEGTQSLKLHKNGGFGVTGSAAVAVRLRNGSKVAFDLYLKKGITGQTGNMSVIINQYFGQLGTNASGVPVMKNLSKMQTLTRTYASSETAATGWENMRSYESLPVTPAWADFCIIEIDLTSATTGDYNIDRLIISET